MAKIETPKAVRGTQSMLGEEAQRFTTSSTRSSGCAGSTASAASRCRCSRRPPSSRARSARPPTSSPRKCIHVRGSRRRFAHAAPEFTAGIARAYLTEGWQQFAPLKVATHGPLFRYERPQKGRFRQFHQLDAEVVGAAEPAADVEAAELRRSAPA
jgi:histidyl-tRNA synthetase